MSPRASLSHTVFLARSQLILLSPPQPLILLYPLPSVIIPRSLRMGRPQPQADTGRPSKRLLAGLRRPNFPPSARNLNLPSTNSPSAMHSADTMRLALNI